MGIFVNLDHVECLYGGTFDPFHLGHEAICRHVLAQTDSVPLRIIPCARPALKQQARASNQDRLAMLTAWRRQQVDADRILIDDIEMRSDAISYTADTIFALKQSEEQATQRVWILGTDAFNSLNKWHNVDYLVSQLCFWVINRAGEEQLNNCLNLTEVSSRTQLWGSAPGAFWFDAAINEPYASSRIRQQTQQPTSAIPKVIADYIEQHKLYQATA
jgi:nicotinate-nucleotide adenylyltransferase